LSAAVSLLEAAYSGANARIMVFLGGAICEGPGQIVSNDLKESMRSHTDLNKGNAPWWKSANKFYDALATRACKNGHVIDVFACPLDQCGLAEMKVCVERTGGVMLLDDSFIRSGVFENSFKRVIARDRKFPPSFFT
jgi:protein transport protein SEC23